MGKLSISPNGGGPQTLVEEQAKAFSAFLPALMRQLAAGSNDPALDLPLAQLRVCNSLCGGPVAMSALSRELGVSVSAMTQLADRMERARLIKRVAEQNDRRVRCLELTTRGRRIMRQHDDARIQRVTAVLEHLTPEQRADTLAVFETLLHAARAARGQDGHLAEQHLPELNIHFRV